MQDEIKLMILNLVFVTVMCKMNTDKVTATKKDVIWSIYTHMHVHTHVCMLYIIDEKEKSFQVSTVKVVEGKQNNCEINEIALLWGNKKKINTLG